MIGPREVLGWRRAKLGPKWLRIVTGIVLDNVRYTCPTFTYIFGLSLVLYLENTLAQVKGGHWAIPVRRLFRDRHVKPTLPYVLTKIQMSLPIGYHT